MKGKLRKVLSLMLAAVVAFGMIGIGTGSAYAASKWKLDISGPSFVGNTGWVNVYDENYNYATITNVKSSNPKVVKVYKDKGPEGELYFSLGGKKIGKAKITVWYKTPKGKTGKKSKTIKIKAYPNMIKSLKINGKEITVSKSKNSYYYYKEGFKKSSADIKLVPAKGWKIDMTYGYVYKTDPWKSKEIKFTKAMAKGKKTVSFLKKYDEIDLHIVLINEKSDDFIDYSIDLRR